MTAKSFQTMIQIDVLVKMKLQWERYEYTRLKRIRLHHALLGLCFGILYSPSAVVFYKKFGSKNSH